MKRLVGFIGNINSNDIEIILDDYGDEGRLTGVITNKDKIVNDKQNAGVVVFQRNYENDKIIIHVNWVRVEPEYENTRIALMLLKDFDKQILTPAIDQYGAKNVTIEADFQNRDIAELAQNLAQKRGIGFNDENESQDVDITNKDYVNTLQENGINASWQRGTIYITNTPITQVKNYLMSINSDTEFLPGSISDNGSTINYAIFSTITPPGDISFNTRIESTSARFNSCTSEQLKNTITNFDNFCTVFDGLDIVLADDKIFSAQMRQFFENSQQQVAKTRLKKLIKGDL